MKAVLSVLQVIAFCLLTVCTVVLMQCHAAVLLEKPTDPQTDRKLPAFVNRIFIITFTTARDSVSIQFMPPHTI
jgi:hypothetical protein